MPPRNRLLSRLAIVAGFMLVTIVLTAPLTWRVAAGGPINTGDGQMSIWNVAWVARALVSDPLHVFDANIFAPHRNTLAYSEANLVAGALAIPTWWATHHPYVTYNVTVFLAYLLSALFTFGLVTHLAGDRRAAGVSALLFAFAPFVIVRYAHIQLLMVWSLPLALWAMHRFVEERTVARTLLLSAALVVAGLSSGYYGFFAGTAVGLGFVYYGVRRGLWRQPRYLLLCALCVIAAGLAIAPFFLPYLSVPRTGDPFRTLDEAARYSADWGGYLTSTTHLHRLLLDPIVPLDRARFPERVLFPGLVCLSLAALALVLTWRRADAGGTDRLHLLPPERETAGFYGLVVLVAGWLSFGPRAGLYALAFRVVPAWWLMRAPARYIVLIGLSLAVLAGLALAAWLRHAKRPVAVALLVGAAAMIELSAMPWDVRDALPVSPVYRALAHLPAGAVVELPFFFREVDFHRNTLYMLYSTYHWHPVVNGYSDFIPEDFRKMVIPVSSFPAWEALGILYPRGTRYAVFHLNLYDVRSREKLMEKFERYRDYIRPVLQDGDTWLFEIIRGTD